jgi:hypothetical protein
VENPQTSCLGCLLEYVSLCEEAGVSLTNTLWMCGAGSMCTCTPRHERLRGTVHVSSTSVHCMPLQQLVLVLDASIARVICVHVFAKDWVLVYLCVCVHLHCHGGNLRLAATNWGLASAPAPSSHFSPHSTAVKLGVLPPAHLDPTTRQRGMGHTSPRAKPRKNKAEAIAGTQ